MRIRIENLGSLKKLNNRGYFTPRHRKTDGIKEPATRETWTKSAENEFGRLIEVLKRGITGTQIMKMVHRSDIPKDRKVTYARFLCNYRPQK